MVTRVQEESRDQIIQRLAQKARESGVKLRRDARDGRHYASSASRPGHWHYVTAVSCDCLGFASHARCMHHSGLLVALVWAGNGPEPEPIQAVKSLPSARCESCNGLGTHPGTIATGPKSWTYTSVVCERCHGRGELAA